MNKMLPCPFCGEPPQESQYLDQSLWGLDYVTWHKVYCSNCDIGMSECKDYEALQLRWNHRVHKPEVFSMKLELPNRVMQSTPTDCFRACVASVLGIPLKAVPEACDGACWDWDAFQEWLAKSGWQCVEVTFANGGTIYPTAVPLRCIITGPSPRECKTGRHAVVADLCGLEGFAVVHDPHESQLGLSGDPTHACFFVRIVGAENATRQYYPVPAGPHDPTLVKIHIDSCISSLRDEDGRSKTRELSLAVTKLQEAVMWIDEHLKLS